MILVHDFLWDDHNIDHIARHHVKPEEVEEIFESPYYLRHLWGNRYIAYGRSQAGRHLFVAFDCEKHQVACATARNMTNTEKKLYKRKMGK